MSEEEKKVVVEHLLLKEEVLNDFDSAVKDFQNREITDLMMYSRVKDAWAKANKNEKLHRLIDKEIQRRRLAIHHGIATIDLSKGDPIRAIYDPNRWLTNVPPGSKVSEKKFQEFILGRIKYLREFFVNLRETSQ